MPSLLSKLLHPKQSHPKLKDKKNPVKSTSSIKRWTSRNKNGTSCSLPPELVLRILHNSWNDHSKWAARHALLCKTILERTRRYLYTCPTLSSATQINQFIKTLRRNPNLATRIEAMILDGGNAGSSGGTSSERMRGAVTTRLPHMFELCENMRELTLKNAIVFSLTDFANADGLLHLTLDGCLLSDRTTTQRYHPGHTPLNNVTTLTLRDAQFDLSTADHFLCPRTLPKVVALELEGCRLVDSPADLNDLGIYEPRRLAANLEYLLLSQAKDVKTSSRPDAAFPVDIVERCLNLKSLEVDVSTVSAHVLEHLPLSLTHLTISAPSLPEPDIMEPHVEAAQVLSTSFLTLASLATSSTVSTPFGTYGRSPLSTSVSPLSTPLGISPFGSPAPSPPSGPSPLSELNYLTLPLTWNLDLHSHWKSGEFTWAVGRISRECQKRLVEVGYEEERKVRGGKVRGRQMANELDRVRKAVPMSEREPASMW